MSIFTFIYSHLEFNVRLFFKLVTLLAMISGISMTAYAEKIVSEQTTHDASGFGGWNLYNVNVQLNGGDQSSFNQVNGSYWFPYNSNDTCSSTVYLDILKYEEQRLGHVLTKTRPAGEYSGIKTINDDAEAQQVTFNSPCQTHKRYRLAMLPTTVADGAGNDLPIPK